MVTEETEESWILAWEVGAKWPNYFQEEEGRGREQNIKENWNINLDIEYIENEKMEEGRKLSTE